MRGWFSSRRIDAFGEVRKHYRIIAHISGPYLDGVFVDQAASWKDRAPPAVQIPVDVIFQARAVAGRPTFGLRR